MSNIFSKLFKKAHARNSRDGETTYVTGNTGSYIFHDKPQFKDHKPSSHLMADNGVNEAWAAIYKEKDGSWTNQNYDQAVKRNEVYKFHGKKANERMVDFAVNGNWKNKN